MTFQEAMVKLKRLGTARNVKIYRRHGAGEKLFGVSFANMEKLRKQIGTDHSLALQLWKTENSDARTLAVMIADPAEMTANELEHWIQDSHYYVLVDLIAGRLASKLPHAGSQVRKWIRSEDEWVGQAGWSLLATMAVSDRSLPDTHFAAFLPTIRRGIHGAKNRTKHSMNNALIAIGIRSNALYPTAAKIAQTIGKVEIDHGKTGCKTPDALDYMKKARTRRKTRS